jgi:hypothetical protein
MSLEPIFTGPGEDPQVPLVMIIEMAINLDFLVLFLA